KLPDPIDPPAYAPWTAKVEKADASSEARASAWLKEGGLLKSQIGSLDDERVAPSIARVLLLNCKTDVVDIMSAGKRVAFQVKMTGKYAGGLRELAGHEGVDASLYATGFADIDKGEVCNVKAVTDRYTMERRILAA